MPTSSASEMRGEDRGRRGRCRVIAISGTPGVGKSTVATTLARVLGTDAIDLSALVVRERLYIEYDSERKSYVIDEDNVKRRVGEEVASCGGREGSGYVVVEGHYAEIVDDRDLEILVVLRMDPRELIRRLCARGWDKRKSLENGEAEYIGVCIGNAISEHPIEKICEIDATNRDPGDIAAEILEAIKDRGRCPPKIDWASHIDPEELYRAAEQYCH